MSHIHLPDGVLPLWLWLGGYLLTALLIGFMWRWGRATANPQSFALLGIFAAMMILVMMIEIPPFSYHFNLSIVTGIILGPQLSVVAALMVNIVLALIGHGGVTVIGLNTLTLSIEMIAGYYLFALLSKMGLSPTRAGFLATFIGLAAGSAFSYGVIIVAIPWIDRTLQSAALHPGEELGSGIGGARLDPIRLAVIIFGIGAIGWVLEGILSAAMLSYLLRVYPDLAIRVDADS